jgi:hypothetical protein
MGLNAAWHRTHPMPARPTLAQRVRWHLAHAKHCACRPIPGTVRAELRRIAKTKGRPGGSAGPALPAAPRAVS